MDAQLIRQRAAAEIHVAMLRWSQHPMQWGIDDCLLGIADVVKAIVGKDPARRYRGRYGTRLGAMRLLGTGGALAAMQGSARALHWRKIAPDMALPGDVGLVRATIRDHRMKERSILVGAICRSRGWFVARAPHGFAAMRSSEIEAAWAIA